MTTARPKTCEHVHINYLTMKCAECREPLTVVPTAAAEKARRVIAMTVRLTKELHDSPKSLQANMNDGLEDMQEALAAITPYAGDAGERRG